MKIFAIDIGGSSIKYACMDENQSFLYKGKIKTPVDETMDPNSTKYNLQDLYDAIDEIIPEEIDGIAISMPGAIDSENGIAITGGVLTYIKNTPVEKYFHDKYQVPVWIGNDAKCAGIAEVGYGVLQDVDDAIAIILGTGIGGVIIKDKKVHNGKHFTAGEVSCLYTSHEQRKDFSNIWALMNGISGLLRCVQKHLNTTEKLTGEEIFALANAGNKQVLEALDEFCLHLAYELYNMQAFFDPEKIAIGGGISAQPILIEKINEQYRLLFYDFFPPKPVPIVACKFLNDANLIGAYYQLRQKMQRK